MLSVLDLVTSKTYYLDIKSGKPILTSTKTSKKEINYLLKEESVDYEDIEGNVYKVYKDIILEGTNETYYILIIKDTHYCITKELINDGYEGIKLMKELEKQQLHEHFFENIPQFITVGTFLFFVLCSLEFFEVTHIGLLNSAVNTILYMVSMTVTACVFSCILALIRWGMSYE